MPLHPRGRLLTGRAASSTLSNSELKVSKLIRVEWEGDLGMRMAYLARVALRAVPCFTCLLPAVEGTGQGGGGLPQGPGRLQETATVFVFSNRGGQGLRMHAALVLAELVCTELGSLPPTQPREGMAQHGPEAQHYNPSTGERGSQSQGYPWLHNKFKASLGYRSSLRCKVTCLLVH